MITAEIFCLGNELLIGRTVNKNATDIALAISQIGYKITRVTTVRDEIDTAVAAFRELLKRGPDIVCVSGGLGPTFDDIQLQVIADACEADLVFNKEAAQMIENKYKSFGRDIDANNLPNTAKKMAMLPDGAVALNNSQGTAPGVRLRRDERKPLIFCLPGVPKEMNAILKEEVIPFLQKINKNNAKMVEFGFTLRGIGESSIVKTTKIVMAKFPQVNFKSHPRKDSTGYWLSLQTYLITHNEELVKSACVAWKNALLANHKIQITEIKPVFNKDFQSE